MIARRLFHSGRAYGEIACRSEESRTALKTLRARFLAALGMTALRGFSKDYSSQELATRRNEQADILRTNDGGVTFSGGESLAV